MPAKPRACDLLTPNVSEWSVSDRSPLDTLAAARGGAHLVLLVGPGEPATGLDVLDDLGLDAHEVASAHEPSAEPGKRTPLPLPPGRYAARMVHLVGRGSGAPEDLRAAGAEIGRATRGGDEVVIDATDVSDVDALAALVEGAVLGAWTSPKWTGDGPTSPTVAARQVTIVADPSLTEAGAVVASAVTRSRAALLARQLGITPSNIKNPAWMAAQARTLGRRQGLAVKVWTERDLAKEGFGGLLAVGGGSATPPRLVQLDYEPPRAAGRTPHVVLVGKGITFDSGGLNVKPAEGMLAMKTDMMGSAAVLAVLAACRDAGVAVKVTGLLALAENAVSGAAYRPSDVVTHYGGTTVEIGNTDAEGRIVLADALAYADKVLRPDVIVDIATLTGAARVALARAMAPVYATDDTLRDALVDASVTVGETLWPMPLTAAYRRALDSDVADVKQFSSAHGGGSIMAALFLREFVGSTPWAHLDIAGPGRSDVDAGILAKGATGFGTRLLLRWLEGLR